jgi:hypothetical protein
MARPESHAGVPGPPIHAPDGDSPDPAWLLNRNKASGGRAQGSHCKCKCCGALGFYKKGCGK